MLKSGKVVWQYVIMHAHPGKVVLLTPHQLMLYGSSASTTHASHRMVQYFKSLSAVANTRVDEHASSPSAQHRANTARTGPTCPHHRNRRHRHHRRQNSHLLPHQDTP